MSGTGKSKLARYMEAKAEQRRLGLELDSLLDRRNAMAAEGPKFAGVMRGTEADRDKVVTAYAHEVAQMDSDLGKLRFKRELLDVEVAKIISQDEEAQAAWYR